MKRYNQAIMRTKGSGDLFAGMRKSDDGQFVLYDEAQKVISEMRQHTDNLRQQLLAAQLFNSQLVNEKVEAFTTRKKKVTV